METAAREKGLLLCLDSVQVTENYLFERPTFWTQHHTVIKHANLTSVKDSNNPFIGAGVA